MPSAVPHYEISYKDSLGKRHAEIFPVNGTGRARILKMYGLFRKKHKGCHDFRLYQFNKYREATLIAMNEA